MDHDTSFDATEYEESIRTVCHSCDCGYSTTDKSNFNKHKKRCRHAVSKSTATPPAQAGPCTSQVQAGPSSSLAKAGPSSSPAQTGPSTSCQSTYVCDQCGKSFRSKFGMQLHVKNKHTGKFLYECTLCDKKFNQKRPYRYHCGKHLQVAVDKCHHCSKEFNSPGSLSRHLVVCQGTAESRKFKCDKCPASFPYKYRLSYHKKGKHGPKRYACDVCGKLYGWRSSLKEHKAVCNK